MNRVILSSVVISCFILAACGKKQPPANTEVPVNLYTVKAQRVLYYDKFPATANALSQVALYPEVAGAITGIFFKEGTHVEKGQLLYEIDKRIYQANYDAAVANLKVQQGTLVQAQQDADRYDYLNKYNAVAKQLYDHAVITLQNAKNTVSSAEQAVKSAKTSFAYAEIKAPFSGTIGFSQVKLGNVVTVGTTLLNTISTDNPMAVDFVVNEKNLPKFEKILHDKTAPVDSLFTFQMPDNTIYGGLGKIYIIDRAVDPQTGSITVRLVFPNTQNMIRVGMSGVVRVHNQETTPQLVVPGKAVVEQMGEYFIFVARDTMMRADAKSKTDTVKKKQLVALQKKVVPGQTIGADMIIKSGINDGDRIVIDGVQSLHDASPITTANKVGPSAGGKGGRG